MGQQLKGRQTTSPYPKWRKLDFRVQGPPVLLAAGQRMDRRSLFLLSGAPDFRNFASGFWLPHRPRFSSFKALRRSPRVFLQKSWPRLQGLAGGFGIPGFGLQPRLSSSKFRFRVLRGAALALELLQPLPPLLDPSHSVCGDGNRCSPFGPASLPRHFSKAAQVAFTCRRAIDLPSPPLPCPTSSLLLLAAGDRHALSFSASSASLENVEVVVMCGIC